ncbi:hypothetical protein [Mesorhizobium sp. Root552]|uniref:hypothetical protein n=1 Tax=Mesorhizobium sp. Root552 TaxID=1736555 RepID=UPI001FCCE4F7|nr:hypothetical protein [Mesorhizobium sp. Root552]
MGRAMVKWGTFATVLLLAGGGGAYAQAGQDRWRFTTMDDGLVTASLAAVNKLTNNSGTLSYSPVLTIACRTGGDPQWSEWLRLNDMASGSTVTVSVAIGDNQAVDERWVISRRGKVLIKSGPQAVSRLVPADRLALSWRFGLLSGRGEADFDLEGIGEVVGQLAEACQTTQP